MKHTPGPWEYRECKPYSGWWFIDCPNGSIGWGTFANPPDAQEDYGESNIRVMAAAPDLLEACKALKSIIDNCEPYSEEAINRAEVAIKKAGG